jgi:hypothetical protein
MITLKRTAIGAGTLLAVTFGVASALEVPRSPAENESIPQPPMLKAQAAGLPPRPDATVSFQRSAAPTAFDDLDVNGDGSISPLEAGNELADGFATWDSNGDGRVSRAEYARYRSDRGTLARRKQDSDARDRF